MQCRVKKNDILDVDDKCLLNKFKDSTLNRCKGLYPIKLSILFIPPMTDRYLFNLFLTVGSGKYLLATLSNVSLSEH